MRLTLRSDSKIRSNRRHSGRRTPLWLAIISFATVFCFTVTQFSTAQKKKETELRIDGGDVRSLDSKLQGFEEQLSGPEKQAMGLLLWRAAKAPLDDPAGTNITGSFFDLGSPTQKVAGGGIYVAKDVQGQRKQIGQPGTPGGLARGEEEGPNRPPPPQPRLEILTAALGGGGGVMINPTIGPKHDDPAPPPPETINAMSVSLEKFGGLLSPNERGIMNWLLQRAGSKQTGPRTGTPGGQPPTLAQALGLAAFESRPAANAANGWILTF